MTDLSIGTIRATATDWPGAPDEVPRMVQHLVDGRLEAALSGQALPEGDWCVRRLEVPVELDPGRPLSALETDWADQIVTILRQSLTDGSVDVVRYQRPEEAVDDLLRGLVTRRCEHAWAWRQVGLLSPDDPEPSADARTVFLRVLARLPQGVAGAMARLLGTVGVAAVHRLLGGDGWIGVAALAAGEAGADWRPDSVADPESAWSAAGPLAVSASPIAGANTSSSEPVIADVIAVHAARVASERLAAAFRDSGLRVDRTTLEAWAVLALAAADPSLLRRTGGTLQGLVGAIAEQLRPPSAGRAGLAGAPARTSGPSGDGIRRRAGAGANAAGAGDKEATGTGTAHSPASGPAGGRTGSRTVGDLAGSGPVGDSTGSDPLDRPESALTRPDSPDDHSRAEPEASTNTRWGGLLFLLNTASAAGLPEGLDEAPLLARPASWVLHRLGLALVPAAEDDPAVLALAGLIAPPSDDIADRNHGGQEVSPSSTNETDDAEGAALASCAARWAAATAALLRADDDERDDLAIVRAVAERPAAILHEPGWIEVRLSLDDVDLDIRRAGLDLDPGWLWWLGQVVRFRYE